jgi:fructokinase
MNDNILCVGTIVVVIITGAITEPVVPPSGHHTTIKSNPGGNALNVAMDLAGLSIPAGNIYCCGAIGNDSEADFLKSTLTNAGVIDKTISIENSGTAKAIIISDEKGERSFIVDKGASTSFKSDDLLFTLTETNPGIFYIGESPASPDIDKNLKIILKHAKNEDCITVVDYIVQDGTHSGVLFECAPHTDILHINEYEAKVITGTEDITKAAAFLRDKGFPVVFVSEGEKGFVLSYADTTLRIPVFNVECVDATGAGDAFCSGIIHSIRNLGGIPADLTELALFASACGACAVTTIGCTTGLTLEKAEGIVGTQGDDIRRKIKTL